MLWSLGQPVAFLGLLTAFLAAVALRAIAMRATIRALRLNRYRITVLPHPRRDIDPFGAVAAALGGTGWGRPLDDEELVARPPRGAHAAVLAAGIVVSLITSQLVFAVHRLVAPDGTVTLLLNQPSDVLRGAVAITALSQFLVSLGVGLLCFALLALIPLPPTDGFGLAWLAQKNPGNGAATMWKWLVEYNLGTVLLLVLLIFPFGYPLMYVLFDVIGTIVLRLWA